MDYCRFGWSVVPIEPRGKESTVRWHTYQHRQPEMTEIGDWFNRWPGANLAIVTGIVSALVALDLDPRRCGESSLERLEQEHSSLPETVEAATGGGGRHIYFAHPGGIVRERIDLAPGIDLHGDGGYLVAPPSVHASGESYRWVRSPEVFPLQPLPNWLLNIPTTEQSEREDRPATWLDVVQAEVTGARRNDSLAILCGYLLRKGVAPSMALELLLCWNAARCRPPLDAGAVAQAVEESTDLIKSIRLTP